MDEIINIKVNGNTIIKDYNVAGTQYEANRGKLRISFSDNWNGYGKYITFWDAIGANPVKIQLGTDLLEDILTSDSVYIVPIPGEAMTEGGKCSFVIEGIKDGVKARTVADTLKVLYSPIAEDAGEPSEVTPDLAEQLRGEIDGIKGDIAEVKEAQAIVSEGIITLDKTAQIVTDSAEQANTAQHNAWESAASAMESKEAIENMTVSSETLEVGEEPTVTKYEREGIVNLHFGLPIGDPGVYIGDEEPTDPSVEVWIDTNGEPDHYVTLEEQALILSEYTKKTELESVKSDVKGLQQQINEEAHFRGYLSTNAKIQALEATPNDFAYSAESGTKWVYDAESGWQDTGTPVPDQLTPASDATPLVNGVATPGESNEYARGDHRHPTDTTRVGFTDYASSSQFGIVKVADWAGTAVNGSGQIYLVKATNSEIDARVGDYKPIVPTNLEHAVKSVGDGYYATEEQVGEIDTALDSIKALQQSYIGGGN